MTSRDREWLCIAVNNIRAPGTGAPQPGDTAQPASEVPEALQFAAPLVGGGSLDFSQYAGTTVALWFWAPT